MKKISHGSIDHSVFSKQNIFLSLILFVSILGLIVFTWIVGSPGTFQKLFSSQKTLEYSFSASGFTPHEAVDTWVTFPATGKSQTLSVALADAKGNVSFTVLSGVSWPKGGVQLSARGEESNHESSADYVSASTSYSLSTSSNAKGDGERCDANQGGSYTGFRIGRTDGDGPGGHCVDVSCGQACCRDACQCSGTCGASPDEQAAVAAASAQARADAAKKASGPTQQGTPVGVAPDPNTAAGAGDIAWGNCITRGGSVDQCSHEAGNAYNDKQHQLVKEAKGDPAKLQALADQDRLNGIETALKRASACQNSSGAKLTDTSGCIDKSGKPVPLTNDQLKAAMDAAYKAGCAKDDAGMACAVAVGQKAGILPGKQPPPKTKDVAKTTNPNLVQTQSQTQKDCAGHAAIQGRDGKYYDCTTFKPITYSEAQIAETALANCNKSQHGGFWDKKAQSDCIVAQTTKLKAVVAAQSQLDATQKTLDAVAASNCREDQRSGTLPKGQSISECIVVEKARIKAAAESAVQAADSCYYKAGDEKRQCEVQLLNVSVAQAQTRAESAIAISKSCGQGNVNFSNSSAAISYSSCAAGFQKAVDAGFSVNASGKINDPTSGKEVVFDDNTKKFDYKENVDARKAAEESKAIVVSHCSRLSGPPAALCGQVYNQAIADGATVKENSSGELVVVTTDKSGVKIESKPIIATTPNQQLVNPTKPAIFVEAGAKFEAAKKLIENSLIAEKQKNEATSLINQHCSQLSGPPAALCGQVYKDFVDNGGLVTQTPTGIKATDKHGVIYNPDIILTPNGRLSDVYKPITEHGVTTVGQSFFKPTGEVEITDLNKQCNAAAGCDAASYARQWCWDQNNRGQGGKFFKYGANDNQTTSYCGEYQTDSSNNPANNKGRIPGSDSDRTSNIPESGYFKQLCNGTDCAKVNQALPQIAQILPKYSGNVTPDVVNYTVYDAPKYVNAALFFLPGFSPADMCKKNPYGQFIYSADIDKSTGLPINGNSMGGATALVAGAVDGIVGKTVGNNVRCGGDGSYKVVADINEYGKEEVLACTAAEKNAKKDENGNDNPCKNPDFFRNKLGQDASGKNVFVTGAFVRDQATKDGVSVELLKVLAGNGDHPSDLGINVLSGIFGAAGANEIGRQNNLPDCTSSDSDECKNFRANVKLWLDQIGVPYDSKIGSCNISGKDTGNYGTGTWSAAQCGEIPKFISFETNAAERFHRTILNPFQAVSPVGSATVTKTDTITGLVGGLAGYGGVGTVASIGFGSQAAGPITLGIYTGDAVGQYINNISARDQLRNVMGIPCNLDGNSVDSLTFTCNTSGINIADHGSVDALVDKMKADGGNKFQPFQNSDLNNPAIVEALKVSQRDCPKPPFLSESPRACLDLHHVAYDDYVKAEALQKDYAKYLLQSGAGGSVVAQQNAKIDEARTNIAMNLIFAALGSPQGEKLLSGVISGIVTPSEKTAAAIAARSVPGKSGFPSIPGSGYITKFGEFINNGGLLGKGTFETVPVGGAGAGSQIAAAKPEVIPVKPNQGMELRAGDQIKVGRTDLGELKPGDIIMYKETTPGGASSTHSIKVEDPLVNPNQKIEIPGNAKVTVRRPTQVTSILDEDFVGLQNGGQIVRTKPTTPVVVAQAPVESPKVEPVTPVKSPPTKPANLTAGEAARLEQIPVETRDDVQVALKQLDDLKKSNPNALGQNLSQEEWYRLSRAKALDVMKKSGVTGAEENVDLVLKDLANDYPGVAGRGNIFEQVFTPSGRGNDLLAKLEPPKAPQPVVATKPTPAKTATPEIKSKPTVAPKTEPIKAPSALPAPVKPVESAPPTVAQTTKTATGKQWWEFWKTDEQSSAVATKTFSRTRRMTVYDMGRSPDANLLITGDKTVSRLHAEVTVLDDGTVYIADTSSLNGTIVRGQKISSVTKLEIGDSVKLGDTTLKFTGLKNGEPRFVVDQSPSVAANITNVPIEKAPVYGAKPVGKSISAPLAPRPSLQRQINDLTAVENDLARGINSPRVKAFWKGLARDTEGRWLKYSPGGVEQAGNYFKFGVQAEADLSNNTILGYVKANVKARKSFLMALDQGNFVGNSKQFEQWLINLQKEAAYKGEAGALRQGYAYSPGHTPIIQDDIQQLARSYGDPYSLARPNSVNKVVLEGIPEGGLPYDLVGKDSVTHFYPDSKYFPNYYEAMQRKLVDIRQGFASGASRKQLVQDISDFYQIAANVRNFEEVNNSLYMNMVNAMLEKAGINPVEQGILDFAAMRLQPKAFRAYFADEVVRVNPSLVGEVGSNAVKVGPAVQLGSGYVPGSGLQKASDGISEALTNLWRKATGRPTVAVETVVDDVSGAVFQYRTVGKTGSSIDSWSLQNGNWVQTPEGWVQVDKNTVIEQAFKGQADQAGLKLPQSETMDFVANADSTFRFKGAKDVNGNLMDTSWQIKNDVKIAQKIGDNVGVGSVKPYELGANGETLQVNNIAAGNKLNIKAGQQTWDSASGKWVEIKEGTQVGFVEPGQPIAYRSLSGVGEKEITADTRIILYENAKPVTAEVPINEFKVGTKVGEKVVAPEVATSPLTPTTSVVTDTRNQLQRAVDWFKERFGAKSTETPVVPAATNDVSSQIKIISQEPLTAEHSFTPITDYNGGQQLKLQQVVSQEEKALETAKANPRTYSAADVAERQRALDVANSNLRRFESQYSNNLAKFNSDYAKLKAVVVDEERALQLAKDNPRTYSAADVAERQRALDVANSDLRRFESQYPAKTQTSTTPAVQTGAAPVEPAQVGEAPVTPTTSVATDTRNQLQRALDWFKERFGAKPTETPIVPAVKPGAEVQVRVGEKVTLRDTEGNLSDVAPKGGMKIREINPDGTRGVAQDVPLDGQFPITSGHSFEVLDSRGTVVAKGQVVEVAGKDITGEGWTNVDFGKSGAASLDVQSVRVQTADGTVREVPLTDGMKVTQSSYPNSYAVGEQGLSVNLHEGSTITIFDGTNIVAEGKIVSAKGNVRPYVEPQPTVLERFQSWWEKTFGAKSTETPVVPAATNDVSSQIKIISQEPLTAEHSFTPITDYNGGQQLKLQQVVSQEEKALETAKANPRTYSAADVAERQRALDVANSNLRRFESQYSNNLAKFNSDYAKLKAVVVDEERALQLAKDNPRTYSAADVAERQRALDVANSDLRRFESQYPAKTQTSTTPAVQTGAAPVEPGDVSSQIKIISQEPGAATVGSGEIKIVRKTGGAEFSQGPVGATYTETELKVLGGGDLEKGIQRVQKTIQDRGAMIAGDVRPFHDELINNQNLVELHRLGGEGQFQQVKLEEGTMLLGNDGKLHSLQNEDVVYVGRANLKPERLVVGGDKEIIVGAGADNITVVRGENQAVQQNFLVGAKSENVVIGIRREAKFDPFTIGPGSKISGTIKSGNEASFEFKAGDHVQLEGPFGRKQFVVEEGKTIDVDPYATRIVISRNFEPGKGIGEVITFERNGLKFGQDAILLSDLPLSIGQRIRRALGINDGSGAGGNGEGIVGRIRRIFQGTDKKVTGPITLKVGETVKVELPSGEKIDVVITPETKIKTGNLDDSAVIPQDFPPDGKMSGVRTDEEIIIYDKNGNPVRGKIVTSSENVKPTAGDRLVGDKLDDAGNAAVLTSEEQASQQGTGPVFFYDPWGWYRRYAIPRVIYEILRNTSLPGGMFIDLFWIPPLPSKDSLTTNPGPNTSGPTLPDLISGKDSKETSTTPVNVIYRYTFPDAIPPATVTPPNASGKVVAIGTQCELVRAFAERYPNAKLTTQPDGYKLCDLAKKWNISADYFLGQMLQESGFVPDIVNGNSTGLLQMESDLGYGPFASLLRSYKDDAEAEAVFDQLTGNTDHKKWLEIKAVLYKDNETVKAALQPYLDLKNPLQNMMISTYYLSWSKNYVEKRAPGLSESLKMDMAFAVYNKYTLAFDMFEACKADPNGPCKTNLDKLTWGQLSEYLETGSHEWIKRVVANSANEQYYKNTSPEKLRADAVKYTLIYIKNIETYRARMNIVLKSYPNGVDETNYQKFKDELYRTFGFDGSKSAVGGASGAAGDSGAVVAHGKIVVGDVKYPYGAQSSAADPSQMTWTSYVTDYTSKKNELAGTVCDPGSDYQVVENETGVVVCGSNQKYSGQCFPGSQWSDSSGSLNVCGNDYLWHGATDPKQISNAKQKYDAAMSLKTKIEQKYGVKIVNKWGYWTEDQLKQIDAVLQVTPESIYRGSEIVGIVRSTGGKEYWGIGGYHSGGGNDAEILLNFNPLTDYDRTRIQETALHELLHRYAEKANVGDKDPTFEQQLVLDGIKLQGLHYVVQSNQGSKPLDNKYDCSGTKIINQSNSAEVFACTGTQYRFNGSKLKSEFPNVYNYYKTKVFGGKEY